MVRQTRRAFLAAVGATSLAGCGSTLGSEGTDTNASPTERPTEGSPATTAGAPVTATATPANDGAAGTQFDGFEAIDRWYRLERQGSLSGTTGDAYDGAQSMRLRSDDGNFVGAYKAFSEPRDMSEKSVSMALKVNSPSSLKIRLELLAPDRGNKLVMTRTHLGPTDTWIRVDMGATREVRDPDLSSVQEVRIVGQKRGDADEPIDLLVDDVRLFDRPDTGYVMLTFDDVWRSHYDTAFPLLEEFGFKGVEGVVADAVYGETRLDVGMMREMRDAGWDMASRPATREFLPELSGEEQRRRIERNRQFLVRKGFRDGVRHFITPSRRRGPGTMEIVRELHDTMFTFGGMPNGLPSTTRYNFSRINAGNTAAVKDLVDLTGKYSQLLVCNTEDVGSDRPGAMAESDFRQFIEYVDRANVKVVTASDLLEMQR